MALVITLSLIVLVTIAVMAFFARATSNRLIEAWRKENGRLVYQLKVPNGYRSDIDNRSGLALEIEGGTSKI